MSAELGISLNAEWITDRLPTEADGDEHQEVRLKRWPHWVNFVKVHWSHVGFGVPWQHTSDWQPPAEPTPTEPTPTETDRIAALEQRVTELKRGEDAVGLLYSHLQSRLEKLEGVQDDGSAPRWTVNRIAALEQRVAELEARASQQMGLMARLSLSTAEAFESLRADR
jgi:hypothetical protein